MTGTEVLNHAIAEKKITDRDLAKQSTVHIITVRRYISGEIKHIGPGNAVKLAPVLGVTATELMLGRPDEPIHVAAPRRRAAR
jgi:transcriptional regulator with XRE-family HTH domain